MTDPSKAPARRSVLDRFLNGIETTGNKLPDPAVLFLLLMGAVRLLSWPLSRMSFDAANPVSGEAVARPRRM